MEGSTLEIIKQWESCITKNNGIAEIVIETDLKILFEDIISRTCFGSDYAQGKQIFAKLAAMQAAFAKPSLMFGFRNLRLYTFVTNSFWKSIVNFILNNIIPCSWFINVLYDVLVAFFPQRKTKR